MNPPGDPGVQLFRVRTTIYGAVQGVGFRPFVFRLANELGLVGWVSNSPQGVLMELEADKPKLDEFLRRLELEKPPRSYIQSLESSWFDPIGYTGFVIRESAQGGPKTAFVMPDVATCPDCLSEIFDPQNRRYLYPFTNCTNCGPRFSIIEALPYDRANTSMKAFRMCPQCQREYDDPMDRRFHAQPNACPLCGPGLELWAADGTVVAKDRCNVVPDAVQGGMPLLPEGSALHGAVEAIRARRIVAVKGLGGFHLMVRADSDEAVRKLRERKHREEKPFAVMFPYLEAIRECCEVSSLEERLLSSPESPIVLLPRLKTLGGISISPAVAPANPNLGVLLPYTPLHHLLLASLGFPVVATSGNLSDEPICTDEHEALYRLGGIADLFLVHNRPIVRHVDDSIVRVMADRELVLRRARGFAPLPIQVRSAECGMRSAVASSNEANEPVAFISALRTPNSALLAVGAHLKNAVALAVGPQVFVSQHIGDLETTQAYEAFRRVIGDFQRLYDSPASQVVADAHPGYLSTQFAQGLGLPLRSVQHHVAHVLSCMAESDLAPPVLGVSWDGTGYGVDETIWGGEFFLIEEHKFERVAHFRQFLLPGSELAIKEPRRSALGLLFDTLGDEVFKESDLAPCKAFSAEEKAVLQRMLSRRLNSPLTSSVGRLFDAVASLAGVRQRVGFEGQAAMDLEFLLGEKPDSEQYEIKFCRESSPAVLDWRPVVQAILRDIRIGVAPARIAARFHNTLVESVIQIARFVGLERVVLSGGCFQNRYLTEQSIRRLRGSGFRPYWHQRVPPNDGGICLGQVVAARWWSV